MTSRGTGPEALDQRMDARRVQLDLTWAELAARAGISREALRGIRNGSRIRSATKRKLETALGWAEGGMDVAQAGGEPRLISEAADSFAAGLPRDTLIKALAVKRRTLIHELGPELGSEAFQRWVKNLAQETAEVGDDQAAGGAK